MRTLAWISVLLSVLLWSCGDPIVRQAITCDGETTEGNFLIGKSDSPRFLSNRFGEAQLRAEGLGRNGTAAIRTAKDGPMLHFVIESLQPEEHFTIQAWQNRNTASGMIHVLCPDPENPLYEWQLRRPTQRQEGDWIYMVLDITVSERMAGLPLHVFMKPGGKDSVVLFDDIRIERLQRRPVNAHHRRGSVTDKKTGRTFATVQVGGNWWMAEDLESASKKRAFTYDEAQEAVPEGWHIPTDEDWFGLELKMGVYPTSLSGKGGRGNNLSYRILEGGDSGMEFAPTTEEKAHAYWTSSPASDSSHWARFIPRHTGIGRAEVPDMRKLKLRCVMNLPPQP